MSKNSVQNPCFLYKMLKKHLYNNTLLYYGINCDIIAIISFVYSKTTDVLWRVLFIQAPKV